MDFEATRYVVTRFYGAPSLAPRPRLRFSEVYGSKNSHAPVRDTSSRGLKKKNPTKMKLQLRVCNARESI